MNQISPYTGWTRAQWAAMADRLLAAARPYASPGHARVDFPGLHGGYGPAVDGLEGFARTFLLAGFRLAGEQGKDPAGLAAWYAEGLATGVDRSSPERWVRLNECPQARVEAASIALILDMTRPWIWDRLDPVVQNRLIEYLAPAAQGIWYPRCNWVWFRLVVQTFLRSVGGPHNLTEMAQDLETHDSFVRGGGWLADGDERAYDHYVGWALHLYPILWARMAGAAELATPRVDADRARLDRFLLDAVRLVGADGAPLAQGRSLVYRFAAAAPFWVGAMADVPSTSPGLLRRAASGVVRHFTQHGVPNDAGVLDLGWFHQWVPLRQRYSGPGSPYWAVKGMLGLALPATHPVWTATEEPLPVESSDHVFAIASPGWVVSATKADGVVRVCNHGTDHAVEGSMAADSPLYTRLGYSTATFPLLHERSWRAPLDQSVVLIDRAGDPTHRCGMHTLHVGVDSSHGVMVGVAASRQESHWVDPEPQQENHGSGYVGRATPAGSLTVVSLLRGPWEMRLVRVEQLAEHLHPADLRLRVGGWPVSGGDPATDFDASGAMAEGAVVRSRICAVTPVLQAATDVVADASPLDALTATPWLAFSPRVGEWAVSIAELTRRDANSQYDLTTCAVAIGGDEPRADITVYWPDGVETNHSLVIATPTRAGLLAGHLVESYEGL